MPIYEYRCRTCGRLSSLLLLRQGQAESAQCSHCQSPDLERLMSRFAAPKSDEARMQAMADPSYLEGVDESDPQSMTRLMRKMGEDVGEDLGEEFDEAAEADLSPADATGIEPDLSDTA